MRVGVPKEIKDHEDRVGLVPSSVAELVHHGHEVLVERGAGVGAGLGDDQYTAAGARIVDERRGGLRQSEMIVKVKEPLAVERKRLRRGQVLFTYLHLAPDREQTEDLLKSGVTAIAYETVTSPSGTLPLLTPMSEVAGRLAPQVGAHYLERAAGGRGVLLGGVPGVPPAEVVVLGGGVSGTHAATIALGMGATVFVVDRSAEVLRRLAAQFPGAAHHLLHPRCARRHPAPRRPAGRRRAGAGRGRAQAGHARDGAPDEARQRHRRHRHRPGRLLRDVASRPSHSHPTYVEEGVIHYCVTNMPGAVARTSTFALNNATLPFVLALADKGWRKAIAEDPHLRNGLNVHEGKVTCRPVAEALGLPFTSPEASLSRYTPGTTPSNGAVEEETHDEDQSSDAGRRPHRRLLSRRRSIVRAQKKYDPGVSDKEIKLGHTNPYSGPLSAYGVIGKGITAYWNMVNDQGGVNGRKINFITYDDGFQPPKTVEMVRKLVEDDQVFAIYQLLGTPTNTVVQKYLNQKKVPQLFVATGASKWGMPKEFPWTMGWQPDYATEAAIYAKHIMANHPNAKVAMLYQNDDSGKDYLHGFQAGFGKDKDKYLIETVSYEVTDPTVDSQVIQLKDSGADVFFNDAAPKAAAQAIRKVADLGWKPEHYLANVSASVASTLKPAGLENSKDIITAAYLKDPTDPQWESAPDFIEWKAWMAKYMPGANLSDACYVYAYAVSATMRHVLTQCGDLLTRENLMKQAASMKNLTVPLLLPGIKINTSPTDFYPIQAVRLARFDGETWRLFGDVLANEST